LAISASCIAASPLALNKETFDGARAEHDTMMVEFFAPWCGHCKKLAPEYEKASEELEGTDLTLATVDCTEEKDLCGDYGVKGFPTLKVFLKDIDTPIDYKGGRTSKDIVTFMKKQGAPAFFTVDSSEALQKLIDEEDIVIAGFFASEDAAGAFVDAAKALRMDYTFALVSDADATAAEEASEGDVIMYKNFDDPKIVKPADGDIADWARAESFPLVGEIGPENFQKYVDRALPLVWIFVDFDATETVDVLATANKVAADFKGQLSFVKLDGVRWKDHAKNFGLTSSTPGIVIENREKKQNFVLDEEAGITAETLHAHCTGFVEGTLPITVKSEDPPENNDGPVTVVVGTTYEDIVMDDSKDVFVEFYAPWCGHCKSLAPKWDALGEEFADVDSVVIAKVDATANDVPEDVKGFPTLVFYPAGDKAGKAKYSGDRTTEAMAEFVRNNAKSDLSASTGGDAAGKDEL
jgi:protein disulfide-isomerase A1